MRECKQCKKELDSIYFLKPDGTNFYRLCPKCRELGRERNNRRRDAKNQQAKEHYEQYKQEVSKRNKEWRKNNKEKLRQYENSTARKQFHSQWVKTKRKEEPHRFIYYSAKHRAKKSGIPFDITHDDVINIYPIDGKCPILGLELQPNLGKTQDNSPSLDRLVPEKGYIKNNIIVISHRANRIKNNATLEELEKLVAFLKEAL